MNAMNLIMSKIIAGVSVLRAKTESRIENVPVSRFRHYCGFRYSKDVPNFYQNYILGLHNEVDLCQIREEFIHNLISYRPKTFNDALVAGFSRDIPLWTYPWSRKVLEMNGWVERPIDVPDIITHYSETGIVEKRIEEEFFWLERAYKNIKENGYKPKEHSYITAMKLTKNDNSVYILLDGNHRAASLVALGFQEVTIKVTRTYDNGEVKRKLSKNSIYSPVDVDVLFDAYFNGVDRYFRSNSPAAIIW